MIINHETHESAQKELWKNGFHPQGTDIWWWFSDQGTLWHAQIVPYRKGYQISEWMVNAKISRKGWSLIR